MSFVHSTTRRLAAMAVLLLGAAFAAPVHADGDAAPPAEQVATLLANKAAAAPRSRAVAVRPSRLDHSGAKRVGMASFYAHRLAGRRMADGTPMRPESDNAASLTLPLGTTAMVTNLRNGRTALVTIRDRGPYAGRGRIIDLSPATARQLGMITAGVARVEVQPVVVPKPGGRPDAVVALAGGNPAEGGRGSLDASP